MKARLLDLVVGRSGPAYAGWLKQRGEEFRSCVEVATLDPFRGYKNAIDDQLQDAVAVLDAFHVVKLAGHAVDEVRRRVQQEIHGHRGRKNDPLYRIRNILHAGAEHLTERQQARLSAAIAADERHDEVWVAYQCAQQVRSAYHQASHAGAASSRRRSSPASPPARSRRSPASAAPWRSGVRRSSPTSPPKARTTAAPKPSTVSSSSTDASPAASATARTTACECSSSEGASTYDPTLIWEEPHMPAACPISPRSLSSLTVVNDLRDQSSPIRLERWKVSRQVCVPRSRRFRSPSPPCRPRDGCLLVLDVLCAQQILTTVLRSTPDCA